MTLLAGLAGAATVDVPPGDPSIRYLGRTVQDAHSGDIQWGWSASGASITFAGTSCSIRFHAQGAIYDVFVDGVRKDILDLSTNGGDTLFALATGLPQGTHTVAVRARTEMQYSIAKFHGFRIDGTPGTAPAGSDRRIEYYGNSITCGYGILDSLNSNHFSIRTEDEALSYAGLAADSLGADRHTICWSGRGVIQNYGGDVASPTLPKIFRRVVWSDSTDLWDFSRWTPDVVVIDLGTNDYSTSLPDSAKFHGAYTAFVDTLHALYPQAGFLLVDGPMLSAGSEALNRLRRNLDDVVADATKQGIKASHLALPPQDGSLGYGADWHPSAKQAVLNGKQVAEALRTFMGWDATSNRLESPVARTGLVRTSTGLSILLPPGSPVEARLLDARGRVSWQRSLAGGTSTILPRSGRWLVLDSEHRRQVLPVQTELR